MTTGTVVPLSDERITESSSLACSRREAGIAHTLNDDPTKPHLFAIESRTGHTVGTITLKDVLTRRLASIIDSEAVDVSGGATVGLGDIGDNKCTRKWIAVWMFPEPESVRGDHTVMAVRYRFRYPHGTSRNSETLLFHPTRKARFIVTKQDDHANVYRFPDKLSRFRVNELEYVGRIELALVTDGSFSPSGRFAGFRQKGKPSTIAVVEWATLRVVNHLAAQPVNQPESVAIEPDGGHALYGSEGKRSPLGRITWPAAYR